MIEFNGWISIEFEETIDDHFETTFDGRLETKRFIQFEKIMEPLILNFNMDNQFIQLKKMNGLRIYYIGGAHNHRLNYFESVIEIYEKMAEIAPLSFGLLYVRLPEDEESWNKYRVFRLAKGAITEHEDLLLSPCDPVIED